VQAVEEGLVPRIAASLSELHDRTRDEQPVEQGAPA
jgi:hypothetical protein